MYFQVIDIYKKKTKDTGRYSARLINFGLVLWTLDESPVPDVGLEDTRRVVAQAACKATSLLPSHADEWRLGDVRVQHPTADHPVDGFVFGHRKRHAPPEDFACTLA